MALRDGPRLCGPFETIALIELFLLSLAVVLHSLQLDDLTTYRQSPLIVIEVLGLLGAFFLVPVCLIRAIYLLFCCQLLRAIVNGIICVTAIGIATWAMWFDSPTLIHMT